MRRINIRRVAIALGVGVVVNVLVAWYRPVDRTAAALANGIPIAQFARSGTSWPIRVPRDWPPVPAFAINERNRWEESTSLTGMLNGPDPQATPRFVTWNFDVDVNQSGWPCRALVRYGARAGPVLPRSELDLGIVRRGLTLPPALRSPRLGTTMPLPLMPVWPGFAINTLFYGTLAFAAMAGVSAIRRRRRFKRGLCVQCAYPLTGGEVCPECGVAVRGVSKAGLVRA